MNISRLCYMAQEALALFLRIILAPKRGKHRIVDKVPVELHERTPLFIGSWKMMEELAKYFNILPGKTHPKIIG